MSAEIPVYLIVGFLESGKTTFLQDTIDQDYFQIDDNTLLLICEEGEVEYDPNVLRRTHTYAETIESKDELRPAHLEQLRQKYGAGRVIIEYNGVWDPRDLKLPKGWFINQQIMMVDGSTFDTYFQNMKSVFGNNARNSEVIIVNRSSTDMDLPRIKRIFRAVNSQTDVIFENEEGELDAFIEEDLPYDLNAPVIDITNENYGIWFLDASEYPDHYDGKRVRITAMIHKTPEMPEHSFVPGRLAMNCCEADMVFLGYLCKSEEADRWRDKSWVTLTALVKKEYLESYGEEGPVLYAEKIEPAQPISQPVTFS